MGRRARVGLIVLVLLALAAGLFLGLDPVLTTTATGKTVRCGSAFLPSDGCGDAQAHLRTPAIALIIASVVGAALLVVTRRASGDR